MIFPAVVCRYTRGLYFILLILLYIYYKRGAVILAVYNIKKLIKNRILILAPTTTHLNYNIGPDGIDMIRCLRCRNFFSVVHEML